MVRKSLILEMNGSFNLEQTVTKLRSEISQLFKTIFASKEAYSTIKSLLGRQSYFLCVRLLNFDSKWIFDMHNDLPVNLTRDLCN